MNENNYYAVTAYNSKQIPQDMPPQSHWPGGTPVYMRLPWGGTKDTTYDAELFKVMTPKKLREFKGTKYSYSFVGDERFGALTHQYFRDNSYHRSARAWSGLYGFGVAFIPVSIIVALGLVALFYFSGHPDLIEESIIFILKYMTLPAVISFILGYTTYHYFPSLVRRPGLGSKWELNRQTGMVTNYTYNKKDPGNPIAVDSVPFYECDAYMANLPTRYGITHSIGLQHRYSKRLFHLDSFLGRSSETCDVYRFWDFIQNYMDTSKPLPDIPVLEQFRSLDPVTAEYDKQTGRDPEFYFNMNKQQWYDIRVKVFNPYEVTVRGRGCLMQRNGVKYFDECTW